MKFVPDLPSSPVAPATSPEVKALTGVRRAKPVQARTQPPLIVQPHVRREAPPEAPEEKERRHDPHVDGERRIYCRRLWHEPFLIESRSGRERRRHNQRADDPTEHIDVEA